MNGLVLKAHQWIDAHSNLCPPLDNRDFLQLNTTLKNASQLANKIAKLNPHALFLRSRSASDLSPDIRPIGLLNENTNDCFMNSIRQLFVNIEELSKHVMMELPKERYGGMQMDAICYWLAQLRGDDTPLGGSRLARAEAGLQTGRQEDASEAICTILNELVNVQFLNPLLPLSPENTAPLNPLLFWTSESKRYQVEGDYNDLALVSQQRIGRDGWLQAQKTPNVCLTLPIKGLDDISLEMAFARWANSALNHNDPYRVHISSGGTAEWAFIEEQNRFHDLPNHLLFSLKRFERELGRNVKDGRIVDVNETFVISGDIVQTGRSGRYRIKGFVSHIGTSADNGHYVAYIYMPNKDNPSTGSWYLCDDKVVRLVDLFEVRSALQTCYFAFANLEEEIPLLEARGQWKMRHLQASALEQRLALEASLKLAAEDTPKARIAAEEKRLGMLRLFSDALHVPHASPDILKCVFLDLPRGFQTFCSQLLVSTKRYSETEALDHLGDLATIKIPYLIKEGEIQLKRDIVEQYLYMKEQYLLFMKRGDNLERVSTFQLKQLLALQEILQDEALASENLKLVFPHLNQELQKIFMPFLSDFSLPKAKQEVETLIEATKKLCPP